MSRPKAEFPQKRTLLLCLAFLVAFLLVAIFRSSLHSVDIAVNTWMPSIQSGAFTVFAVGIDDYFDTNFLVIYSVVIAATFFVKHRKQNGLLLVGAMAGAALLVSIVKRIELVPRPDNAIVLNNGYSFPSGHTVGIVVLGGVLAYFAWSYWKNTSVRAGIAGGYGVAVGLVSFDRVYLNTHWFSDVFGSLLLGAFWLLSVILLYSWLERKGSLQGKRFNTVANWLYVGAVVLAVLVVVSGAIV
ncbi:MAG TPA: phosphatase PAP2 family protein [Candidatus Acidoferrales bacterium]|nr:phosphatase PAP2 family protein [Candidatus Acidoferrales bacterium]